MKNTIQLFVEISLDDVRSKNYDKNVDHAGGEHTDTCHICGKRIKDISKAKTVHQLTNGNIVSYGGDDVENSQGFFPVGNDCAKKLVINFAH